MSAKAPAQTPPPTRHARLKLGVLLAVTAVLAALVWNHVTGINGPAYWRWPWRAYRGLTPYAVLLAAAVPTFLAEMVFAPPRRGTLPALLLMMTTVLGFEVAVRGMDTEPFSWTRVTAIVEEPGTTGYFTHARAFVRSGESVRDYLRAYTGRMAGLSLHAQNKPPGAILFYVPFIRATGTEDAAALAAGLAVAALATLGVPAAYVLVRELTGDPAAAFHAAAFLSLCPGLVLFLPESDQYYPIYTAAFVVSWALALRTGWFRYAVAFGLVFSLACFQTFNLLVLGGFIAGYSVWFVAFRGRGAWPVVIRQAAAVAATCLAVYAGLGWWSGYNPIRTILTGVANHNQDMPATHRVWPGTVPFDLADFALGTGWVSVVLTLYYFLDAGRRRSWRDERFWLVPLCVAQPVLVALLGVLQGETARVWIFMFPLLMVPVGLELTRWSRRMRMTAFGSLWLLTALLAQNMVFV